MAKFVFYISTGFVGASKEETIEIPDEELEGMTEDEIEQYVEENYYRDWVASNAELSFWRED